MRLLGWVCWLLAATPAIGVAGIAMYANKKVQEVLRNAVPAHS